MMNFYTNGNSLVFVNLGTQATTTTDRLEVVYSYPRVSAFEEDDSERRKDERTAWVNSLRNNRRRFAVPV